MNPTPSKRRRSSSPSTPPSLSTSRIPERPSSVVRDNRPSASPANPTLPPPIPSFPAYTPAGGPGPSTWQSWRGPERGGPPPAPSSSSGMYQGYERDRMSGSRRSMDARSPVSDMTSPCMEGIEESSEMVFTRDTSNRAPRSMMACTRCRRQKMKCDGPSQVPCRGCRQSGQPCIFEARSRPKSISSIPSRPPPFFAGQLPRPPTPTGPPGFYPAGATPAPPVTTRSGGGPIGPPPTLVGGSSSHHASAPPQEYALRSAREPMPPPPATSISALASPYAHGPPRSPITTTSSVSAYYPAQGSAPAPAPYPGTSSSGRPVTPSPETRLRSVESAIRSLQALPNQVSSIQGTLNAIARNQDMLLSRNAPPPRSLRAREIVCEVPELVWESYRSRAWPLTPWLVGLREASGLPGLVVSFLGRRTLADRSEERRKECEETAREVLAEIGRLVAERLEWTREEIRALGVFATWTNDTAVACLGVGHARSLSLDRVLAKRGHDDWREWIYLSIMDKLCQVVDFNAPVTSSEALASTWRDRLTSTGNGDPAVRDRDLKLLAWLEYAETLSEVYSYQQSSRLTAPSPKAEPVEDDNASHQSSSPRDTRESAARRTATSPAKSAGRVSERESGAGPIPSGSSASGGDAAQAEEAERRRPDPWKRFNSRWEAWAGGWSVRNDPILSLHFNYAVLYTASPCFLGSSSVWTEMSQTHEGFQKLERGRDAAFAVIHAICSPEISRTLPYSFALYRPLLGLAFAHILSLTTTLTSSPLISASHVLSVVRSTQDTLIAAAPLDLVPASTVPPGRPGSGAASVPSSLLAEITGGGIGIAREVLGQELGRELWRRILG